MTKKLGVYWSVAHRRPEDYDYFRRLNPSVMKCMDGGDVDYKWIREHLPNSLVVARIHALSEQHEDMLKDPAATGHRHAREWDNHQRRLGFDRANTLVLGVNEPRLWEPGVPEALRVYTIALCDEATRLGLRVGAMQLSVGWPANTGPDTPPNWEPFRGVDNAIRRNNGALVLHEYWADNGPGENWGWWAGRSLKCPWQVPIIIGECGVDMYVKDASVAHNQRGWHGRMHPNRYAQELAEYTGRMSADKRFLGCCVFASDFANREWWSFDIEPAYQAILATPIPDPKPPLDTYLPVVIAPGKPFATVNVSDGANIRVGPGIEYAVWGAEPYGTQMSITGRDATGQWWYVEMPHAEGWVSATVVEVHGTADVPVRNDVLEPAPQPESNPEKPDNWPRIYAFIKKWEGGWADHPADPGGATNKGITLDTFRRWRAAQGKPVPTKDDLRDITDAEAERIFFEWYYKASGADKLSWPLNLAHTDTAVNAGVGRAQEMLNKSGGNFLAYMGHLVDWYTRINNFEHFGKAWIRRRAEILLEASK